MQPIPTINVNLKPCNTDYICRGVHLHTCPARPVLIPCHIPRSVTFAVRLGECACTTKPGPMLLPRTVGLIEEAHEGGCPARPIEVTCSISGKTWPDSEVVDAEYPKARYAGDAALSACRDLWALLNAMVLGDRLILDRLPPIEQLPVLASLKTQRDAVYAAIAEMARLERAYWSAAQELHEALPDVHVSADMQVVDPGDEGGDAPSARWLASYVEYLIEQVGVLP